MKPFGILLAIAMAGCLVPPDAEVRDSDQGHDMVLSESGDRPAGQPAVHESKKKCAEKAEKCKRGGTGFEPHVLVAVSDSAINPYHEVYYRPERTAHPCTYIQDYPCDIPELPLSVGAFDDVESAVAADATIWGAMKNETWYWIPRTNLVAVYCAGLQGYPDPSIPPRTPDPTRPCLMESFFPVGGESHGTETSSSLVMENPDVSLLFSRGTAYIGHIASSQFPVDLYSHSFAAFGEIVGFAGLADCSSFVQGYHDHTKLFVAGAGNSPNPTWLDCLAGDPNIISVGGGYAQSRTQELLASEFPDIVSYYCRPVAQWDTIRGYKNGCGTSIAAPTAAGALSKAILAVRRETGYVGGANGDVLEPTLGITRHDVRHAMNLTATYEPQPKFPRAVCPFELPLPHCPNEIPLVEAAPWFQWGWGFYDNTVSDATAAHLLGLANSTHPADAVLWMGHQHEIKKHLWGA